MAVAVSFRVDGVEALKSKLNIKKEAIERKLEKLLVEALMLTAGAAKKKIKVRTGDLKPIRGISKAKDKGDDLVPPFALADPTAIEDPVHLMNLTGNLRNSIIVQKISDTPLQVAVGTAVKYGVYWERGIRTKKGNFFRYPFLGPAWAETKGMVIERIREGVREEVESG